MLDTIQNETSFRMYLSDMIIFSKEWETSPDSQDVCWPYTIDFLERKSFEFNDSYIYQVKISSIPFSLCSMLWIQVRYSIPTRRQPIPRHTALVYFTIDVSKINLKVNPDNH